MRNPRSTKPGRGGAQPRPLWAAGADLAGNVFDLPGWIGAARTGNEFRLPREEELIELPKGAPLQFLEGRAPLSWPKGTVAGKEAPLSVPGIVAVAAQLPSGYTRTLLPAYQRSDGTPYLPFFGYTAVFYRGDKFYCAAVRTDKNSSWQPQHYGRPDLGAVIEERLARDASNRVLTQLKTCALEYGCYNAQNIFLGRWEGAAPVSPACNAQCLGCISQQPEGHPPSPQVRFRFVPSLEEVVQVGKEHLRDDSCIFSFGQGCEGEPLLQGDLIARSVRALRLETQRGTIHLNTNASRPQAFRAVAESGLDSVRVSLNSVLPDHYEPYYQPRDYVFEDILECLRIARHNGIVIHLNYLHLPGWNDREEEVEALLRFLSDFGVHMVQMRNLNIDPDMYASAVAIPRGRALGVIELLRTLRERAPRVRVGNHTVPKQALVP